MARTIHAGCRILRTIEVVVNLFPIRAPQTDAMVRNLADGGPITSVVIATDSPPFRWIDVGAPDRAVLRALNVEHGLPDEAIQDFLDPQQLPKYEHEGRGAFIILRAHAETISPSAANVRELTEAFAIYTAPGLVLTIHHRDHRALAQLRSYYASGSPSLQPSEELAAVVLDDVIRTTLTTFAPPSDLLARELAAFEDTLLSPHVTEAGLERVFIRRRRASALVTLLRRTREVIARLRSHPSKPDTDETAELVDTLEYRAHELLEYADQLINLQIAVASHRTNQVMRLLTLISVVFMPLTFVVGFYGMNFDLPEYGMPYGYLIADALIVGSIIGAVVWFRRRGWLG